MCSYLFSGPKGERGLPGPPGQPGLPNYIPLRGDVFQGLGSDETGERIYCRRTSNK